MKKIFTVSLLLFCFSVFAGSGKTCKNLERDIEKNNPFPVLKILNLNEFGILPTTVYQIYRDLRKEYNCPTAREKIDKFGDFHFFDITNFSTIRNKMKHLEKMAKKFCKDPGVCVVFGLNNWYTMKQAGGDLETRRFYRAVIKRTGKYRPLTVKGVSYLREEDTVISVRDVAVLAIILQRISMGLKAKVPERALKVLMKLVRYLNKKSKKEFDEVMSEVVMKMTERMLMYRNFQNMVTR